MHLQNMDPACLQELFAASFVLATCPSSCCIDVVLGFLLYLRYRPSLPLFHDPLNPREFIPLYLLLRPVHELNTEFTTHLAP